MFQRSLSRFSSEDTEEVDALFMTGGMAELAEPKLAGEAPGVISMEGRDRLLSRFLSLFTFLSSGVSRRRRPVGAGDEGRPWRWGADHDAFLIGEEMMSSSAGDWNGASRELVEPGGGGGA